MANKSQLLLQLHEVLALVEQEKLFDQLTWTGKEQHHLAELKNSVDWLVQYYNYCRAHIEQHNQFPEFTGPSEGPPSQDLSHQLHTQLGLVNLLKIREGDLCPLCGTKVHVDTLDAGWACSAAYECPHCGWKGGSECW